jgi:hypothetical protein
MKFNFIGNVCNSPTTSPEEKFKHLEIGAIFLAPYTQLLQQYRRHVRRNLMFGSALYEYTHC